MGCSAGKNIYIRTALSSTAVCSSYLCVSSTVSDINESYTKYYRLISIYLKHDISGACTICSISLFFKSNEGTQETTSKLKRNVYWNVAPWGLVTVTDFRTNVLHPSTLQLETGLNYSTLSSTTSENFYQTIRRHIADRRILHGKGKGKVHPRTGHEGPEGE